MKAHVLFGSLLSIYLLAILPFSLFAQQEDENENQAKDPNVRIRVSKEYDENGHLIYYDSTYIYKKHFNNYDVFPFSFHSSSDSIGVIFDFDFDEDFLYDVETMMEKAMRQLQEFEARHRYHLDEDDFLDELFNDPIFNEPFFEEDDAWRDNYREPNVAPLDSLENEAEKFHQQNEQQQNQIKKRKVKQI